MAKKDNTNYVNRQYNDILKTFKITLGKNGFEGHIPYGTDLKEKFGLPCYYYYILEDKAERYLVEATTLVSESGREIVMGRYETIMAEANEARKHEEVVGARMSKLYPKLTKFLKETDPNTAYRVSHFLAKRKVHREDIINLYDTCANYIRESHQPEAMLDMLFMSNLCAISSESITKYDHVGYWCDFDGNPYGLDKISANFALGKDMVLFTKDVKLGSTMGEEYKNWVAHQVGVFSKDFYHRCAKLKVSYDDLIDNRAKLIASRPMDYHAVSLISDSRNIIAHRKALEKDNVK